MGNELKIFNPEITKNNLIISSLFLTSYELLKNSIIDRIKTFLCTEFKFIEHKIIYKESEEYRLVKNKDKNLLEASLLWLIEMEIITKEEKGLIHKIREQRNRIAHNLPELLTDNSKNIDINLFLETKRLIDKIEKWWIIEVDMSINPYFDNINNDELDTENILPGTSLMLDWIIKCAFDLKGNE